jgi:hypothetical protein
VCASKHVEESAHRSLASELLRVCDIVRSLRSPHTTEVDRPAQYVLFNLKRQIVPLIASRLTKGNNCSEPCWIRPSECFQPFFCAEPALLQAFNSGLFTERHGQLERVRWAVAVRRVASDRSSSSRPAG